MSTQTIYRLLCDAPHCTAATVVEQLVLAPEGWVRISSAGHLADWRPGRKIRLPLSGRTRTDPRDRWDIEAGSFTLHLCPAHLGVFDGHRPRTEGTTADRKTGLRYVTVRCSCSDWNTRELDATRVGDPPRHIPERAWWRHLPEDLRWYATRKAVGT